tara:strand:- start:470 stop:889 length:420 start_codon:yes stop_codon:yes gene_type:complete
MANLTNTLISATYLSILKTSDNAILSATPVLLTDGGGNSSGLTINNAGDLVAAGTITFNTAIKDGKNLVNVTKFVDEADGITNNNNDTSIPTSASVIDYVSNPSELVSLNFANDTLAGAGGVAVGGLYHTAGTVKIRLS